MVTMLLVERVPGIPRVIVEGARTPVAIFYLLLGRMTDT
jgi:hypothetical protein